MTVIIPARTATTTFDAPVQAVDPDVTAPAAEYPPSIAAEATR
ncbi:hypothetical protein P0L94_18365 [Microbacter sp. GSS18]|nr:hypothetical protein P0L94_18365 [Microbacter sp. GSS18]